VRGLFGIPNLALGTGFSGVHWLFRSPRAPRSLSSALLVTRCSLGASAVPFSSTFLTRTCWRPSRVRPQIVQTASTEPGTHEPLSRSFTLLFALSSATAALTAVTTLFSATALAQAAATCACLCLALTTLATLPAAAAIVFPEAHRGQEKTTAFVGGVTVVVAAIAAVRHFRVGLGVAELLPVGGVWLLGGLMGGGAVLLVAAAGRALRDLGGRGGAAVLAVAVLSGGGLAFLWTWVEPYVSLSRPGLASSCIRWCDCLAVCWPGGCGLAQTCCNHIAAPAPRSTTDSIHCVQLSPYFLRAAPQRCSASTTTPVCFLHPQALSLDAGGVPIHLPVPPRV